MVEAESLEERLAALGFEAIAGVDEAGRGPLAGPVVACAVILPSPCPVLGIADSKTLSEIRRRRVYLDLLHLKGFYYGLGVVQAPQIDVLGIHKATLEAMKRAVMSLSKRADYLIVDGLFVPSCGIPAVAIPKGDQLVQSVSAASICAKETRDAIMRGYHDMWPEYGFKDHKGYPTERHREVLAQVGPSSLHRQSFTWSQSDCFR